MWPVAGWPCGPELSQLIPPHSRRPLVRPHPTLHRIFPHEFTTTIQFSDRPRIKTQEAAAEVGSDANAETAAETKADIKDKVSAAAESTDGSAAETNAETEIGVEAETEM